MGHDPAVQDALDDLKRCLAENKSAWTHWVVGILITYFLVTITAAFVAVHIK